MSPLTPTPQDDSAETTLIRSLRADDPRALRSILTEHWDPLVGYARRLLSETGDPEDKVQEVLARLWARRKALKEEGSLKALLYTMVRNACLDEIRRRRRRAAADRGGLLSSSPRTPYEDVHGAELQRAAAAAVARLPARRQEVFRLVREEGLSYQEVAEVLALSPQTVANHMSLAMADLRTALRPFLPRLGRRVGEEGADSLRRESPDR